MIRFVPLTLAAVCLAGCSKSTDPDTDLVVGTPGGTTTPVECREVADPGTEPSPGDWTSDDTNLSPDTAWPVGVVTDANGPFYVQTILPSDRKNAYFVFESGADMELRLRVQNSTNDFKWLHLHEASDGCFGDEIPPVTEDVGSWYIENTFDVVDGGIYVMEVRIPGGGFF